MANSKDAGDSGVDRTGMLEADGGVFYAPPKEDTSVKTPATGAPKGERRAVPDRRAYDSLEFKGIERRKGDGSGGDKFGRRSTDSADEKEAYRLKSRSESAYPQAFTPVSAEFWKGLTKEQQDQLTKIQAIAQEKVGYEKATTKYFIDDPHPSPAAQSAQAADPVVDAAPRLVTGGFLLGAGVLALALALVSILPQGPVLVSSIIALLVGIFLVASPRS